MEQTPASPSPRWSANTKLVVALTVVVVVGAMLVKFQFIIAPLAMAFLLSYLFQPVADFVHRKMKLSWSASVSVLFLIVIALLLGLLTLGGVGLISQIQSLIVVIQNALQSLPQFMQDISGQVYQFGPFKLDFSHLDLTDLSRQALGALQPALSRTGSILGAVAGGAANFFGWFFFVLFVSYFVLIESNGFRHRIVSVDVPGYTEDLARLSRELGLIWNAFMRGQIIIFIIATLIYVVVLTTLGVNYAIGLAAMAGLARFVPYAGPFINWTLLFIVSYFQPHTVFGLSNLTYAVVVLVSAVLIDQVFDNVAMPRIMSNTLKVHPAAVLVATIVAANLFGLLGVVVAAPILATAALIWRYVLRKLLDLDPFPEAEITQQPPMPGSRWIVKLRRFLPRPKRINPN
ncbi:MAG: AI-2E family transporter [Anaerolineales bacterium]|nr:AI-2E family transporter [Anaerolineales bacterium]